MADLIRHQKKFGVADANINASLFHILDLFAHQFNDVRSGNVRCDEFFWFCVLLLFDEVLFSWKIT
jgi:hypothetical protein